MKLFYDTNNRVTLIYYTDLPEELKNKSFLEVEELTPPEEKVGMNIILKCDGKKYWYEYESNPISAEEAERKKLNAKLDALTESAELRDDLIQELALSLYKS